MTTRNLTHPKFQPPELNTKLIQIAEAIQLLSDVGVLDLSGGGTGFSSYTLGDLLYGNASAALAKLAGNTTATRKFLRQLGTGSISAPPAWDTLVAGDIPALDSSTALTVTANDVAYASGNFTSATGTWTVQSGDQTTYRYFLIGSKLMLLMVKLDATTTATCGTELRVAIPTGATAAVAESIAMPFSTDGFVTYTDGLAQAQTGVGYVRMLYTNLGNWPDATNLVHVSFTMWISLQ
jgi:hypothetical protein